MRDTHRPPRELDAAALAAQLWDEIKAAQVSWGRANHPSAGEPSWRAYTADSQRLRMTLTEVERRLASYDIVGLQGEPSPLPVPERLYGPARVSGRPGEAGVFNLNTSPLFDTPQVSS